MTKDEDAISRTDLIRKLKAWDAKANGIPNYAWSVINELPSIAPKEWSGIMNYEYEIQNLKEKVTNLQQTVIQMGKNTAPFESKVDSTANQVDAITPYTEKKTAYFGETEKTFYDVPQGNISVFFSNDVGRWYDVKRINNRLTISFDALTEQTDITISVQ